jgi:hypothetical protein
MTLDQNDCRSLGRAAAAAAIRGRSPETRKRSPSSGLKMGWRGGMLAPAPGLAAAAVVRPAPPEASARSAAARAVRTAGGFNEGSGGDGVAATNFAGTPEGGGEIVAMPLPAAGREASGPSLTLVTRDASDDAGSGGLSAPPRNQGVDDCAAGASRSAEGSKVFVISARSGSKPRAARRGASFTGAVAATTRGVPWRGDRSPN